MPGQQAPDFTVDALDGKSVSLKDFRGSYVYITVWATWCVPCKGELPYLDLLQKKYYGRNLKFLTIAIDNPGKESNWREFMEHNPHAGIHTFSDANNEFNKDYMIISVPRFILVGPDGLIVNSNAPRPSGQINQMLESLGI